ncbi:MAG: hypothetical protein GY727_13520 [Gammaproteobacteria bacterium]|nr:hypothetical protein [Gammaproteobacteria bacterium]MCP4088305.1 hypothetical protein [Gammaproteobacteria bacterium]MCP4276384.1 hypothetical protein [Gammaproteobacteria bacterium]MCP4831031.1 hypothetical protein [Gammaproteobacteria bacterium]MCP4927448.1 hypothetical protein [Gammaproteobacteria bacterium]
MSKKATHKPLSLILGAAVITSLGATGAANADTSEDIFSMDELTSGYLTAGGHEKTDDSEGKCGEDKGGEGSCGEKKDGEGKCGEGKCGGDS